MIKFFYIVFLFSFIGINIYSGFRSDHFFLYSTFLILLFYFIWCCKLDAEILKLSFLFLSPFVSILISDFIVKPNYRDASFLQSSENILNPFIIFFVYSFFISKLNKFLFYKYFMVFSFIVSFLSIYSYFSPNAFIFNFFTTDVNDENSVRYQSFLIGRYLGIFNQPIEAGLFHGLVGIFLTYLFLIKIFNKPILISAFFLNFVAGLLSLSKTFYILSLLIILLMLFVFNKKMVLFYITAFLCLLFFILFLFFKGNSYFLSLFSLYDDYGLIMALSAGRIGETTDVINLFKNVIEFSPLIGFGFGTHLPLDNGYLEYFYQGGCFAVLPILYFLFSQLYKFSKKFNSNEGKFMICFYIFLIIANLGGPVFTANKANILVIGLITIHNINVNKTWNKSY